LLRGEKYSHLCDIFACGIILFTLYAGFPPFQHAIGTDWWWNKIELKNYELFWLAHERSRKFNDSLKDLIIKMLAADPKERYDIKDIKKHPWFKGAVWGDRDLKKHIQRRRKTVAKERMKKMREKQANMALEQKKHKYRAMPDETPVLADMDMMAKHSQELGSLEDFEAALENFDGREFVETYTQFKTYTHPREIAERINIVAVFMSGECTVCKEHNLIMIRIGVGDKSGKNENVLFAVKQYTTEIPNQYMVVFKRYEGNPLKYHKIVDIIFNSDEVLSVMDLSEV
jgi:serine/threonine protein kinase